MIPALGKQLAVDGGTRVRRTAFPSWPHFAEDEIAAVAEVMRSARVNYWTGDQGRAFEREFADFCQVKHCIGMASGTAAIHLALHTAGIGAGAEVITTTFTFTATAEAICNLTHR